jgi:hypothetical protein
MYHITGSVITIGPELANPPTIQKPTRKDKQTAVVHYPLLTVAESSLARTTRPFTVHYFLPPEAGFTGRLGSRLPPHPPPG